MVLSDHKESVKTQSMTMFTLDEDLMAEFEDRVKEVSEVMVACQTYSLNDVDIKVLHLYLMLIGEIQKVQHPNHFMRQVN